MAGHYAFTRLWGAVTAGIGWAVLIGAPVATVLIIQTQAHTMPTPNRGLLIAVAAGAGVVVGFLVGGTLIVTGQLLRIAVDSLRVQLAIFERVDYLASRETSEGSRKSGGRFSGLAGE